MVKFSRVVCIVLDGVGVGEAPDADAYGDRGSNSLANVARHVGGVRVPHLQRMGLGNIGEVEGVPPEPEPRAHYARMAPAAAGKDSITGHWELMGCVLDRPFPVYADGFPSDLVTRYEDAIGRRVIGNCAASGTVIINELGVEHIRSGSPILYTSQDSVFQLAAHEDVVSIDELYHFCEIARGLLVPPNEVARVIARPFAGEAPQFYRTRGRRDFALEPTSSTLLDAFTSDGQRVLTIGKIADLFSGRGITDSTSTKSNRDGIEATLRAIADTSYEFVFTNLVDFDTMWGHRNDPRAYALGLEEFDSYVPALCDALDERTLLIVTSDHGNDPTTESTDHSREFVPLLVYQQGIELGVDLGVRESFSDVACTIADAVGLAARFPGRSFLSEIV